MSAIYKTLFDILNQETNEAVGLCCLCFNETGEDAVILEDEVMFDYGSGPSSDQMINILGDVLGTEMCTNLNFFQAVCNSCSKLAIGSYKFIKKCKQKAVEFNEAVENVANCFDNTEDDIYEYKTLYVSINTAELTFEQFYDNIEQAKEGALDRFQYLAYGRGKKKQRRERDFSTIFIKTHELMHDPHSSEYKCKMCLKVYPSSGSLRLHFFSVHFKKEFQCALCPKSFGTAGLLHTHEKESHSTVTCEICGKKLLNRTSTIKRHQMTHLTKSNKVCNRCGRAYKKVTDFHKHMQQETCEMPSRVPGNYICSHCGRKCHYKHQLMAHIRYEHDGAKGHICKWCGRKCYNESALKTHILKHTGEKNFVCAICGGKFVTRQSLLNHTRLHTGERPYSCQYCDQSFLSASRRSEHIERHHTEAVFACDLCDAKYSAKRSLQKHKKRHQEQEQ